MVGSVKDFLPMSRTDMEARGWDELDFIFVSGDAYVDHPGFGTAIICRVLEAHGYRVGIIAQPDWHSAKDFRRLGKPRLAFLVSSGNLDSVLARFTAAKKLRRQDAYSPGGRMNCRPERAVSVYVKRLREAWGAIPVIIGGIEASLRRIDDEKRSLEVRGESDEPLQVLLDLFNPRHGLPLVLRSGAGLQRPERYGHIRSLAIEVDGCQKFKAPL